MNELRMCVSRILNKRLLTYLLTYVANSKFKTKESIFMLFKTQQLNWFKIKLRYPRSVARHMQATKTFNQTKSNYRQSSYINTVLS